LINVTYRTFLKEDCKEALAFWANTPGVLLHKNGEDTTEGVVNYLARNPGLSFVAEHDGRIIGAILCGHDGRRGLIHHLAVDPGYRKMGIGKRLVRLATEQLKAQHIKKCFLFVLKENDIGEAFYKSQLWREEYAVKAYSKVL
jgi:putative acetyltransferase